jgi:hypothetical protein
MSRDVYIAIMRAAARGCGVHLTPDECFALSLDDAIATRAGNGLEEHELVDEFEWAKCDPSKPRKSANQCIGDGAVHTIPRS